MSHVSYSRRGTDQGVRRKHDAATELLPCGTAHVRPLPRSRREGRGEGPLRRPRLAQPPPHPEFCATSVQITTSPRKQGEVKTVPVASPCLLPSPVVDRVLISGAGRNETPTERPLIVVVEPFARIRRGRRVQHSRQL